MRYLTYIVVYAAFCGAVFLSCKKYQDPAPVNDPRLTRPYCNDPAAVNYNWDFPGKPDNSVCFYPTDKFAGQYIVMDTIVRASDALFLRADSFEINISKQSYTKVIVTGFCQPGGSLSMTVSKTLIAATDTTVGDSTTANVGELFCRQADTVFGTLIRDPLDQKLLKVSFTVVSDTGTTFIYGSARKK